MKLGYNLFYFGFSDCVCSPVNSAGNPAVEEPENITESENANAETTVPEEPVNVEANAQNANTPAENTSNARTRGTRSNARNATE